MTKLYKIMSDIAGIEMRLADGLIEFQYDKLSAAMGCGHPADIMDDIISPVGNAVAVNEEVPKEDIEDLIENLKIFADNFAIEELTEPIHRLENYYRAL